MELHPVERRRAPRQRSYLGATLKVDCIASSTQCILRDITAKGGKLVLSAFVPLPDRFALTIPHRSETRDARLVWRRGDEVGVAFEDQGRTANVVSFEAARDLRLARKENDALKARISNLESLD